MSTQEKVKQSLFIRGVCSALLAMNLPTVDNVLELFSKVGIDLTLNKKV